MPTSLLKLASLNIGIILISHTITEEREGRTGKYTCSIPNLPEKTRRLILGMMDLILFVDFETVKEGDKMVMKRVLRTKPSPHYEAGDRTGILPATIPLDFNALKECFDRANATPAKINKSAKNTKTEPKAAAKEELKAETAAAK